jgi:uroporphyrinogen decarboxylase
MIFAGEKPDRFAASMWRHFFHVENNAEGTAAAMLAFQKEFEFDFMKINPRADYHTQDFGLKLDYSKNEFTKHGKSCFPIKTADDWLKIKPLSPFAPNLEEHLRVVSMIRKKSDRELPILMTIFTPLAIAGRLVENRQTLADHIRSHPDNVHQAVRAITNTFVKYTEELRNAGADGIFFATTQWAASGLISFEEYKQYGIPYDLEVIRASGDDAINLLHICESNCYLHELSQIEYNCQMVNWDTSDPTNPPLDKADDLPGDRTLVGGIDDRGWLLHSQPDEIGYKMDELKERFDPSKVIFGPGCAIPPEVPYANLHAMRAKL